jgi:hypothetical protein
MILNAYAVLDAFLALLRLPLGVLVVVVSAYLSWEWRYAASPERRGSSEDRFYLLFLSAFVLVGMSLASWPLLYLVLNSYVPEWPGAMCIYGVTRIGAGSLGAARFLPGLVTSVQLSKPAIVFLAGAWLVLYRMNRATANSPYMSRMLAALMGLGMAAAFDASLEIVYLAIPKREEFLTAGCCTAAFDASDYLSRFAPKARIPENFHSWLFAGYYSVHLLQSSLLLMYVFSDGLERNRRWLMSALIGTVVSVPVAAIFLIDVATPILLHLPYHHCIYDLITQVPESIVALGLFVSGSFAVGWAGVAAWCANCAETAAFSRQASRKLAGAATVGYLGSVLMFSIELMLA